MGLFRYDVGELRATASRFLGALQALSPAAAWTTDPLVWDELTLDWWGAQAAPSARVDSSPAKQHLTAPIRAEVEWPGPRGSARRGPASMTHLSHPGFSDTHPLGYAYWRDAVARERLETLLALQVEWGGGGRAGGRFGRVMLAAADLGGLDARAKALFFATDDEAERRRLTTELTALRLASWDTRPWLWVDVPWRSDPAEHAPAFDVLSG